MKDKKTKLFITLIYTIIGAVSGFLYYKFIGCNGTCFIWSSPWISIGYGALLGGLLSGVLPGKSSKKDVMENQ